MPLGRRLPGRDRLRALGEAPDRARAPARATDAAEPGAERDAGDADEHEDEQHARELAVDLRSAAAPLAARRTGSATVRTRRCWPSTSTSANALPFPFRAIASADSDTGRVSSIAAGPMTLPSGCTNCA
jgi:hypothetical protein